MNGPSTTRPTFGAPLDTRSALTAQMRYAFALNESAGIRCFNASYSRTANSAGPVPSGTLGANMTWMPGGGLRSAAGVTAFLDIANDDNLSDVLTIITRVNVVDSVTLQAIFGDNKTDGTECQVSSYYEEVGGSGRRITVYSNGVKVHTSSGVPPLGVWSTVALVRSGSTGAWTYTLYINGIQDSQTTGVTTNPVVASNGNWRAGFAGGYTGAPMLTGGKLDLHYLWTRVLTPKEIFEVSLNPYVIFQPQQTNYLTSAPAGGAETVTMDKWFHLPEPVRPLTEIVSY